MPNTVKTALLLGALSAVFLLLGDALGGGQGLVLGFVFAAMTNFASYWFSDKVVLRLYNAQEVGPDHRLARVVARLAARAGLPMPRVYVIPQPSPNAFATGRNPEHAAVAATEGILQILTDEELEGVLAHELAHVRHRDILISSFAAVLIQAAISRSREYDADAGGAAIARSPIGLVNALKKIESASRVVPLEAKPATAHMFIIKPFSPGGLMGLLGGLFSTHPPTE